MCSWKRNFHVRQHGNSRFLPVVMEMEWKASLLFLLLLKIEKR
jgi:hypothetical protein